MIIHSFLVFPAVYTHRIIVVHLCPMLRDMLGKRSMIAPVGRAFSVCALCHPRRERIFHKKFIAAALRLSALPYIINAEHIPVAPIPITE